jgi:spore coat protein U-like protein
MQPGFLQGLLAKSMYSFPVLSGAVKRINKAVGILLMLSISSAVAAGINTSSSIPVSLGISGSTSIDISVTTGVFPQAVSGVGLNASLLTQVNIVSTATMPYLLGIDAGQHAVAGRRFMSDGLNPPIAYSARHNGVVFGDANVSVFDPSYVPTSPENALSLIGTGTVQSIAIEFVAVVPVSQSAGVYTDTVVFVVAWP